MALRSREQWPAACSKLTEQVIFRILSTFAGNVTSVKRFRLGYLLLAVIAGFAVKPAVELQAEPAASSGDKDEQALLAEYNRITKIAIGLNVYNQQLERQLGDQERVMSELNHSIEGSEAMRRQLVPLLHRMVDTLEQFVELDLPFEVNQRRQRIDALKESLDRPDISIAEKFRRVLSAYQKEVDYGSNYATYSQFIKINGRPREVDILRWGRIVLAFQTPDQKTTGVWDNNAKQWKVLGSEYRDGIRKAFRMARGITSKSFVILPVPTATPQSP
jgi:hypothetical protein